MAKKSYKLTDKDFAKMKKVHAKANKYVDNKFHFYLSFNVRIILLFVIAFVLGYASFRLYLNSFSEAKVVIVKYNESANVTNDVVRFQNETLDTGNLIVGDTYISDLVDDIGLDFNYDINFGKIVNYEYAYNILGRMTLTNYDNDVIAYRDFDILKDINSKASGDKLIVKQNINLDYDYYNNLANDLNINGSLIGDMHLIMHIKVNILDDDFDHINTIERDIEVGMPLLSNDVKVTSDNFKETQSFVENIESKLVSATSLFFAVVLIIIDTVFVLNNISYIIKSLPKKSRYCVLRDGLLQDYDRIIVNSRKMGRLSQYNIIDCYSFLELMDAQKLLEKPIVYYEIVKNQKCIFYIIDGNDCYQFILKECDIDY